MPGQFAWILAASASALCGNWAAASSVRHLPIGIASALNMSLSTVVSAMLSIWLFDEVLSASEWFWMALIFAGVFGGGYEKSSEFTRQSLRTEGTLLCRRIRTVTRLCLHAHQPCVRVLHPLTAAFCWESTIATMGAIVVFTRRLLFSGPSLGLTRHDLGWIGLYGIPGAVGTTSYAAAVPEVPWRWWPPY